MSRKTICRLESEGAPNPDTLLRVCETLGLPVSEIVPAWGKEDEEDIPTLDDSVFGHRVRRRRRELGIRLDEAAAAAGVSVSTLSRFERLASASTVLLRPVYADDPEGAVRLDNDGLANILGFKDSLELNAYCIL